MDVTIWLQIQKGADVRTGGKEGEGDPGPAWLSSPCQRVEGEGGARAEGKRDGLHLLFRDRNAEKIWSWAWLLIRSAGVQGCLPQ